MDQVNDQMFPLYVDNSRLMNSDLGRIIDQMAYETGPEAFGSIDKSVGQSSSDIKLTPSDHAEEMAAGIPHTHLVTLTRCGHLSFGNTRSNHLYNAKFFDIS